MKIVNRVKKNEDFALIIKTGKFYRTEPMVLHVRNTENGFCRVGLSVSSKIGNAVARNRVKRQLRAMCDQLIDYNSHSLDIVIIVKSQFLDNNFDKNKSILFDLFEKIGVIQ